ncbi:hypothetical protein LOTGIDRAFT_175994 [Lottia gigantea]|uniref:Uncharacterized protein n=1 Tax=Lottia gigantea TaxID=225164 RepID=V3ZQU7_LOTGI|nr:hypothetical protein LOTGIDRAFT_175994 [Lottia gigantea]ESO86732.1 hypothetical protein LOTGIDRAFT_175994 [Lottia gigantea]
MAYPNRFYIGLLLIWAVASSTYAEFKTCLISSGSSVSDNELMNALYLADPNAETGYLDLTVYGDNVSAMLVKNTLSYDSWLAREHDARVDLVNLWSYLNYITVSDMFELYSHYKVVNQGGSKPRGIIDLDSIANSFADACWSWDNVKDTWPYSCMDSAFFCNMQYGLDAMKQLIVETNWQYDNGRWVQEVSIKSLSTINAKSKLGVDSASRSVVIETLFHQDILEFIPESVQDNVFYHSRLMWESLEELMKGKSSFDKWIRNWQYVGFEAVEDQVQRKCSDRSGQPVAQKYYCKAKDFAAKIRTCAGLSDVTPCVYDNAVQEYFVRGRFADNDELSLINSVISTTQTVLTEFKDKVVANDRNGLNSLYNTYNPYITVDDSMCHIDWPSAFDCTNNIGCNSVVSSHGFDCNGGYTCRINMMYRFDCLLKFVLKQTKQLVDVAASGNWGRSEVIKAKNDLMIWLSYIPMARYTSLAGNEINDVIIDTQNTIRGYVTSYDTQGLETFVTNLPHMSFVPQWAKDAACQQASVPSEYTIFCNLDPLLNSVFLFIQAFENSKQSTTKILNPTIDYRTLLDQLQLDRAAHLINVQTETISNQFRGEVQTNFQELSSYFSSLADYDKTKADADIAYIDGQLEVFKAKITSVSNSVEHKFTTILNLAIGINVAELLQKTVKVGVALASMANPIGKIIGDSSVLDFMDALNDLAQAGVTTAVIARLSDQEFPDLIQQAIDLGTKFADNEGQLGDARIFIDKMKDGEDAVDTANDFLGKYNDYTPKVLLADITSFGAKWETVAEDLCEAAFSAESAGSALIEIGLASTGDCVNVGNEIEELITYYEELYEYQFDFMDSLSDAARAYLAYKKANDLKSAYTNTNSLNQAFLKQTAVNAFMVSTLNVWEVVTEYCDALTYTRGGEIPDKCETALRAPSHDAVAQVISYTPDPLCHINNEITDFRDIPTTPANANDQGYIDLNALYARETVTFRIPNFQWLRDNGWFGPHDLEKAVYIKRFEVFLPPLSGQEEHLVEVEAQPDMANYLRPDGTNCCDLCLLNQKDYELEFI